jgi:D-serine deaminase-like pyridoxal phosphate-dependent protein
MGDNISSEWYKIGDTQLLDSPSLVVYPERVQQNIDLLVKMIDDVSRLRPHVKTCKAIAPVKMMMASGINKFKCATISEAEMLGIAGAKDALLAYQPVGPKVRRFIELIRKYPATKYSCLIDNLDAAHSISIAAKDAALTISVYIDLNVGMNRTGIVPDDKAFKLYVDASTLNSIEVKGLHAYDGHIHDVDMQARTQKTSEEFTSVEALIAKLEAANYQPILIAGGSPTFTIHAQKKDIECSPGTFIYWDSGYQNNLPEQAFLPAALVLARVVSLPTLTKVCVDMGHKAIASESVLDKRVYFLNVPLLQPVGHSEEHMVLEAGESHPYKVGDVLYALPYHICPTVALHQTAATVENGLITGEWKTVSRDRKMNV